MSAFALVLQAVGKVPAGLRAAVAHAPRPVRATVERLAARATLRKLARLSPHLLCDIGYEPEDVYAARDGHWLAFGPVPTKSFSRDGRTASTSGASSDATPLLPCRSQAGQCAK